jgi:trimeric autotransporter adhesin
MKKSTFVTALALLGIQFCTAQLFSSGNNVIAGTNVGIGTSAPSQKLSIDNGNLLLPNVNTSSSGNLFFGGVTEAGQNGMRLFGGTINGGPITGGFIDVKAATLTDGLRFRVDNSFGGIERMRIAANGNITMGNVTTPAGYRLYVETGILTEKLKVAVKTSANWADHVFEPGYRLQSISEVDAFIKNNKHLPGVPSAAAMVSNGLDVAVMDAKLLEKIEELTLYVIELNKRMQQVEKENKELKKAISLNKK